MPHESNIKNFQLPAELTKLPDTAPETKAQMHATAEVRCRCCGSTKLKSRGKLPDAKVFAGAQLEQALPGGKLYRCENCAFVFRAPILSKQAYDALYRAGVATTWDEEQRIDHELVRESLQAHLAHGDVLDVGCSAGSLLMPLTRQFSTFGAEINVEAAAIAETRGVHIVAHDLEDVEQLPRHFDAVVSCDVIEHVVNPLEFMHMLLEKTRAYGYVIVSTGNPDAWSWRLFGSRFWYCYLPEHISFVSPKWFAHYARKLGADIVHSQRFVYSPSVPWHGKTLRLALMVLFRISPRLYYWLLPKSKRNNIPVGRGITRDHFIITLRKR